MGPLVLLVCLLAVVVNSQQDKPDTTPPSFISAAIDAKSPLITDAHPLHKAVANYDLPGVKAALAKGADPNQAVQHSSSNAVRYSPMRVALASAKDGCGSGSCKYVPQVLNEIVVQLLCAGANPNEQYGGPPPPLLTAAQRSDWKGAFALLLSGAKVDSGTNYGFFNCGGPRGYSDIDSALTAAVLAAYGAALKAPGVKLDCKPERPASWKPTDGDAYGCYSLCAIRTNGLTGSEASELKAGRVSPSLATKLELTGNQKVHNRAQQEVNDALAKTAETLKGCPKRSTG